MFSTSLKIIVANRWYYVMLAVIMAAVSVLEDGGYIKSGNGATRTIVWLMVAQYVHQAALFGVRFGGIKVDGKSKAFSWAFMWRGLVLLAVAIVFAAPVLFYTLSQRNPTSAPVAPGDVYGFALAFLAAYAVILSLAGTWLPAAVYQRDTGLGSALKRGSRYFLSVLLWVFPTLLIAILVQFVSVIVIVSLGFDLATVSNGTINPAGVAVIIVATLIEAVSLTLISVVLSHYYLKAEGLTTGMPVSV